MPIASSWLAAAQSQGRSTVWGFVPQPQPTERQGNEGADAPGPLRARCVPAKGVIQGELRALDSLPRRSASSQISGQACWKLPKLIVLWPYSHEYSQGDERRRNSADVHGHCDRRSGPLTLIESTSFNPQVSGSSRPAAQADSGQRNVVPASRLAVGRGTVDGSANDTTHERPFDESRMSRKSLH